MTHVASTNRRTLCGIAAVADRDVPLEHSSSVECRRCKSALAKLDRETHARARRGPRIGPLVSVDGIGSLPSEMRTSLRRSTVRVVK